MSAVLRLPPRRMTVTEFLAWDPDDGTGAVWQLRDGEPEMMAPGGDAHGSIQTEIVRLLENHCVARGHCRAVTTPGVIPRLRSDENMLVPDVGVTCSPPSGGKSIPDPVLLVEVLSPSNEAQTRANIWAYTTIPSVREIWVVSSWDVRAEVFWLRPDGTWPERPDLIGPEDELRAESIGFAVPLKAIYRTSGLI
ncbi:MAG: Uma2 family endonuclease [Acetobacteraceae bacterium]|nr:Uma2 family endonuclease [Acetobacteraceae bacterium]